STAVREAAGKARAEASGLFILPKTIDISATYVHDLTHNSLPLHHLKCIAINVFKALILFVT
ncbi:MAG: hypothetical protein ACP5NQ_04065, partial [Vulcanisaeta sp.]